MKGQAGGEREGGGSGGEREEVVVEEGEGKMRHERVLKVRNIQMGVSIG